MPPCGGHPPGRFRPDGKGNVSSRAPVWGASGRRARASWASWVSSRAPVWGASGETEKSHPIENVSSRAPVWGASGKHRQHQRKGRVSSRAPVWGASQETLKLSQTLQFQVVPPCGGHPACSVARVWPVRFKSCPRVGGIEGFEPLLNISKVSSRAPVWGASSLLQKSPGWKAFQVVPPCGGHLIVHLQ